MFNMLFQTIPDICRGSGVGRVGVGSGSGWGRVRIGSGSGRDRVGLGKLDRHMSKS